MSIFINNHKVAKIGISTAGGGIIISPGAPTVLCEGSLTSLNNDLVAPHGIGIHAASHVIATNNSNVYINNILVIVEGDSSTCGHTVVA